MLNLSQPVMIITIPLLPASQTRILQQAINRGIYKHQERKHHEKASDHNSIKRGHPQSPEEEGRRGKPTSGANGAGDN